MLKKNASIIYLGLLMYMYAYARFRIT